MLDFLMNSLISQRFQFQLINNNGLVDQNGCLLITASKEAHLKDQHFERINWIQNTSHWLSVRQPNGRLLVHHFSIILFVSLVLPSNYLHFVFVSISFFHRSNCSLALTIWMLIAFRKLHGLNAMRRFKNSFTWIRLTLTNCATIPVVNTSSNFK